MSRYLRNSGKRSVESGTILTILLISIITIAFSIQPVEASGTIYIRPIGSVDPPGAPIQRDGDIYTFTDNIYDSIVVERDNIVVDGAGYTLQGGWALGPAILLSGRSNVTIKNMEITEFLEYGIYIESSSNSIIHGNSMPDGPSYGIYVAGGSNNNISGNYISAGGSVIQLYSTCENTISGNEINDGFCGIHVMWSSNNIICGNNMTNNEETGVFFFGSSNNIVCENNIVGARAIYGVIELYWINSHYIPSNNFIYHNNFVDTLSKPYIKSPSHVNIWDDGYPSGGNYWTDYTGVDLCNGPYQNETGSDGIGDMPYTIDANNTDRYPLMNPWTRTETSVGVAGKDYPVVIVSSTAIDQIVATKNTLHFESSGPTGEKGYINVIFPMVNTTEIKVFIDGVKLTPPPFPVINTNGTHCFIYFEFTLGPHTVAIQFAPTFVTATMDIGPDTLNLKSNGEFITAYIELPEGYDVADIDLFSVQLEGLPAITDDQYGFVTDPDSYLTDHDGDGILERMVKFDRATVRDTLTDAIDYDEGTKFYDLTLTVKGELVDGTPFEGTDIIVAIKK